MSALISAKDQENVLNGLSDQGAQVRQTKRGWMVQFPNGEGAVISFNGDARRMKNNRAAVVRNGLTWPLDPTPKHTHEEAAVPEFVTEYADYLDAPVRADLKDKVLAAVGDRTEVAMPDLLNSTKVSQNAIKQTLLQAGFLQRAVSPSGKANGTKPWVKVPGASHTFTSARMNTGRRATGNMAAASLVEEREERRYASPAHAKAEPPFIPLSETVEARKERVRRERPEDKNGPVIIRKNDLVTDEDVAAVAEHLDRMTHTPAMEMTEEEIAALRPENHGDDPMDQARDEEAKAVQAADTASRADGDAMLEEAIRLETALQEAQEALRVSQADTQAARMEVERIRGALADADVRQGEIAGENESLRAARDEMVTLMDRARVEIETAHRFKDEAKSERDDARAALEVAVAERDDRAEALRLEVENRVHLERRLDERQAAWAVRENELMEEMTALRHERDAALAESVRPESDAWPIDAEALRKILGDDLTDLVGALGLTLMARRAD